MLPAGFCDFDITWSSVGSPYNDLKDLIDFDEQTQTFNFPLIADDKTLVGQWPITVTMTVRDANGNTAQTDSIVFTYDVKNPCSDASKYTLTLGTQPSFKTDRYTGTLVEHDW